MINAFKKSWQNALILEGRTQRKDFWWALLLNTILMAILTLLFDFLSNITGSFGIVFDIIDYIVAIIFYIVIFTLSVRRFHDIGRGMTIPVIMLVTSILSLSNEIIKEYHLDSQLDINNHILIGIISLIALIYFIFLIAISLICLAYCIQDSEKGTNQYGPNPKGETTQS